VPIPKPDTDQNNPTPSAQEIPEVEVDEVTEWHQLKPDLQNFLAEMFPDKTELREAVKNPELMATLPKPSAGDKTFPEGIPLSDKGLPPKDWVLTHFKTKSAAIRYLLAMGGGVNDIAQLLGVKYQHVRNVKVTHLKRGPVEDWTKW
jgi:hypothetical protein